MLQHLPEGRVIVDLYPMLLGGSVPHVISIVLYNRSVLA